MANNCYFEMMVRGKEAAVNEFIDILKVRYTVNGDGTCDVPRHFWRVFSAEVFDRAFDENGDGFVMICGDCAWSVSGCMGGEGYYDDRYPNAGGTNLQTESERLGISIEVYSQEAGCQFQEYICYDKGECIADESCDWQEFDTDGFDSVEEMNEEYGTNFTQEEFNAAEDGFISVGGYIWEFGNWLN